MTYWDRISRIEAKQTAKGMAEYGQMLEDNINPSAKERIAYYQEELVDALKYSCWIDDAIDTMEIEAYKKSLDDLFKVLKAIDENFIIDMEIIERAIEELKNEAEMRIKRCQH